VIRIATAGLLGLAVVLSACGSGTSSGAGAVVGPGEPWVVYQAGGSDGEDGVFLIRPDGTGYHELISGLAGSETHPEWSPDGSQIAFIHGAPDGTTELVVVDADGTNPQTLYTCTQPCNEIGYPDWSPDGDAIFFSESADVPAGEEIPRTFRIGRFILADGSVDYVRTRDDGLEMWQARVSPDGRTIAYQAGSEATGAAIFTAPVAGGDEFQVSDWELMGAHPDWTADGRIVFHGWDLAIFPTLDHPANMYVVDADGNNLEPLTHFTENGLRAAQTRVAPDGSGVVFTRVEGPGFGTRRLAFLAFGDTEPGWLTPTPTDATHASLRPIP
jgi:Tol biopolymer transport system component